MMNTDDATNIDKQAERDVDDWQEERHCKQCGLKLKENVIGFCDEECKRFYLEEKELHLRRLL